MHGSPRAPARAGRLALALAVLGTVLAAPALLGQEPVRSIEGRVQRPAGERTAGVAGAWVVLHRVGRDNAGPLDSMRTRPDGGYAFRYRPSGDTTAVYFVSTNRGGVAYFTPPMREPAVRGGIAEILVYDTTSAAIPITIRGRHLIVTAPDTATPDRRTVIEVYELTNDGDRTRVAAGDSGATFDAPLPPGITEVTGGEGDLSPDAFRVTNGRLRVTAPLAPGPKQFSVFYTVPATADPVAFLLEVPVPAVEVLVEDPRGSATGIGLAEVDPVQVDGRPFKRFLAQDAAPGTFSVTAPGDVPGAGGLRVMLVVTAVGAAMLLGLGMAFMRKGPHALARRRQDDPESLALEVAALDARFEQLASPSEAQRAEHYLARARLKARLRDALAKRDGLA